MLLTTRPFAFLPSQHNEGETAILGGGGRGGVTRRMYLLGSQRKDVTSGQTLPLNCSHLTLLGSVPLPVKKQ